MGKILGIELAKIQEVEKEEIYEPIEEILENEPVEKQNVTIEAHANLQTEVVTQNPISESFNVEINGVKIKNETSFEINN